MNFKESQKKMIWSALKAGDTLTAIDALERFGCFKLATRVSELKREGYPIAVKMIRTDTGKRIASYTMA